MSQAKSAASNRFCQALARIAVARRQETDAQQHHQRVLDERKRQHAVVARHADAILESLLEKLQRGQIARAQPQRFHVENLDHRDQAQQHGPNDGGAYGEPGHGGPHAHPSDQTARQSEARAPFIFGPRHLAAVLFMIHAEQMQDAVQHQNLDLLSDAVAVLGRLPAGLLERDRDVAQETESLPGRKRQHVGGVVLAGESRDSGAASPHRP